MKEVISNRLINNKKTRRIEYYFIAISYKANDGRQYA